MEPTTETELEIPEALFKRLSKAAVKNGRTVEEEIIGRLVESLDSEQEARTNH